MHAAVHCLWPNNTVRLLIRIALIIFIATATSIFAWTSPGGEPNTIFAGRVISAEKVGDYGRVELVHWEMWKAKVQVETVKEQLPDTSITTSNIVYVYYRQAWRTNYTSVPVVSPPRLQLGTNQVYEFMCHNHTDIRGEFGVGTETNGLCVVGDFMCVVQIKTPPNKSPEPTAVGPFSSAFAVHVVGRRWLSFLR